MPTSLADGFVADILAWTQTGNDASLIRALRSPYSGVPHDTAAAYAKIAGRAGPLLEAIAGSRLALPSGERDLLLAFSERAKAVRTAADVRERFAIDGDGVQPAEDPPLDLNAPVEPQQPHGVRPRLGHFSASALNAYADCARKWFYRYVCSAVEDAPSSASTYGTAFHAALEDFHGEFPQPSAPLETEMRAKIRGFVNWAFERYRDDVEFPVELELQKRRAQRTAQRYVDWLLAEAARAPFTVFGREEGADLELDGFSFVGYIDRLDRDNATGDVTIFDYKTGSIALSAAEYREAVRTFADFQLPFYYWARTAAGDRVSRIALIPLKDALLDVRPISLDVVPVAPPDGKRSDAPRGAIGIDELDRARAKMVEICTRLTSGAIDAFPVATDPEACTFCAYRNACAGRPLEEREKFGR